MATFQTQVSYDLAIGVRGDSAGEMFYPDMGYIVNDVDGVNVGSFVWLTDGTTNKVDQAKGTNTVLAGFVVRENTNVWVNSNLAASLNYRQGTNAPVIQRGRFIIQLAAVVGVATQAVYGDDVYVRDTDGEIVVGVTVEAGYTKTNFKIVSTTIAVGALGKMSNVDDVLGA